VCVWAPRQLTHAHHKAILIVCSSNRGAHSRPTTTTDLYKYFYLIVIF